MDAEYSKLKAAPSFKRIFDSMASVSDGETETDHLPRYTSLKDILLSSSSSPKHATANNEPCNISIRNELVKHAASAYVLSATIINPTNTDQDWVSCEHLCEDMNISCVDLQSFCRPVVELFYQVVHRVRNGLSEKEDIT